MSDDNAKLRELYIAVWKRMLHEFFGWSPREVESWVSPARRRMAAKSTLFYHEDAIFYVLPLCIPDHFKKAEPYALTILEASLHDAIEGNGRPAWRSTEFDWRAARKRAVAVLEEIGELFPSRPPPRRQRNQRNSGAHDRQPTTPHLLSPVGSPVNVRFMVKDSKKYAATGGWGFADFKDGKPAGEAVLKTCFSCHEPAKDRNFGFTHYAP